MDGWVEVGGWGGVEVESDVTSVGKVGRFIDLWAVYSISACDAGTIWEFPASFTQFVVLRWFLFLFRLLHSLQRRGLRSRHILHLIIQVRTFVHAVVVSAVDFSVVVSAVVVSSCCCCSCCFCCCFCCCFFFFLGLILLPLFFFVGRQRLVLLFRFCPLLGLLLGDLLLVGGLGVFRPTSFLFPSGALSDTSATSTGSGAARL